MLCFSLMLHYKTIQNEGNMPWIVFIHGAGGSVKTWNYQISELGQYFNLLLIDLRDHGESKNISPYYNNYKFSVINEDIRKVLDHLKIDKAHFITLSLGSVVIQHFMSNHPERVDKIVMAGGIFKGSFLLRTFALGARLLNKFLQYPTMYRLLSFLIMPRKRNQKARRIYQLQARNLTQKEFMKWVGLYQEFFLLIKSFYKQIIDRTVLVIMGELDFVFLKSAKDFVKNQPNAELALIPKVGHICNIEGATVFNRVSIEFLKDGGPDS